MTRIVAWLRRPHQELENLSHIAMAIMAVGVIVYIVTTITGIFIPATNFGSFYGSLVGALIGIGGIFITALVQRRAQLQKEDRDKKAAEERAALDAIKVVRTVRADLEHRLLLLTSVTRRLLATAMAIEAGLAIPNAQQAAQIATRVSTGLRNMETPRFTSIEIALRLPAELTVTYLRAGPFIDRHAGQVLRAFENFVPSNALSVLTEAGAALTGFCAAAKELEEALALAGGDIANTLVSSGNGIAELARAASTGSVDAKLLSKLSSSIIP